MLLTSPKLFFQYWPRCQNSQKTEIPCHQRPLIARLGILNPLCLYCSISYMNSLVVTQHNLSLSPFRPCNQKKADSVSCSRHLSNQFWILLTIFSKPLSCSLKTFQVSLGFCAGSKANTEKDSIPRRSLSKGQTTPKSRLASRRFFRKMNGRIWFVWLE